MSRTRSPITSRSNCANDSNTLSVSRPMLDVVLNDWVTETKETPCRRNLHQLGEVGERARQTVDLVDDDDVDLPTRTCSSSACRAGRSREAPERPPSS